MAFFAAEVLTLQFPTLHTQSDELTWTPATHDEELPALMVEFSTRPQCGLAYARRVDLFSRLQDEAARFREAHADPNAALQWKKEAEAHLHHVEEEDDREAGSGGGNHDGGANQAKAKKKKFIKLSEEDFEEDWYALLQCAEDATEDEIKTAYRRRCLETHPDKQASRSDELFKRVQRAFEIVGDAEIRHTYDSSRPFDESIPTGDEVLATDADYFQLYAPVFARNKKWCRDPLPSLGDGNSSHADVLSFYARWEAYHTFRDFSHLADIQEIDESMPREEKRYYQRENERELNFYKKEEQKRIRSLVERAKKVDPRIRRKREEEEARRTQEEEARVAFRNQIREAEERKRADAKAREENAKREAVQKVRDEKNAMRDAQAELLAFFQENQWLDSIETNKLLETAVRRPNLVWLFSKLSSSEEARGVVNDVREAASEAATSEGVPAVLRFNAILEAKEQEVGVDRYGEPMKRKAASPTVAKSGSPTTSAAGPEWSEDDLARLTKATAKYPPGTIERWSKICVLLRGKFSEEQAMVKVNDITAALRASAAAGSATESDSATATTTAPATAEETPAVEDWTMAQQRQLEQGLRELKDYKEKDKYQKIAKMVEGKTAKECFDRFKYLCSVNRKK